MQGSRPAWAWGTHQERSQAVLLVGKLRAKCARLPQSRPPPSRAAGQTQEPFGMDVGQLPVRSQERLEKWACGLARLKGTHTVSFREGAVQSQAGPALLTQGPWV